MMLFDRPRWPVNDRPLVAVAPCCGVRSVVTPGVITREAQEVAAVDRQVLHLLLSDHAGDGGVAGVDDARLCQDVDAFFDGCQLHREFDRCGLAEDRTIPLPFSVAKPARSSLIE